MPCREPASTLPAGVPGYNGPVGPADELIREIADDLGVSWRTLRNWLRHGDLDDGPPQRGLTMVEQGGARDLHRLVRVLGVGVRGLLSCTVDCQAITWTDAFSLAQVRRLVEFKLLDVS